MTIVLQIDALTGGFRGNQKTHLSLAEGFRGLMPPYCFLRLRTMFSGKSQTFISVILEMVDLTRALFASFHVDGIWKDIVSLVG